MSSEVAVRRPQTLAGAIPAKLQYAHELANSGLLAKVTPGFGGCWLWTATKTNGYGVVSFGGRLTRAHRVAWELAYGPIPEDRPHIDHLCRVRACIRPDHLEPVTQAENNRRMGEAHLKCPAGHDLPEREPGKRRKQCAICKKDYDRQRYLELGPRSQRGKS